MNEDHEFLDQMSSGPEIGDFEAMDELGSGDGESEGFEEMLEDEGAFEDDGAFEGEGLFDDEGFSDFEDDGEYGLGESYELDDEGFSDFELEPEADEFFGGLMRGISSLARRVAPVLRTVAPIAIRALGSGMFEDGEDEFDSEAGDSEDEMEAENVPGLGALDDALAEELAAAAAAAASDAEAQSLAGGITIHIMTPAPFKVKRLAPIIVKRSARLVKVLRRSRRGRPLLKVLPKIKKKTVATLVRKARKGKKVTRKTAVRVLKKQARKVLSSPKKTAVALKRNKTVRRKLKRKKLARKLNKKAIRRAERFA